MNIFSHLWNIFVDDEVTRAYQASPRNITEHYIAELKNITFDEVCV
jgi:hypothetical protein